MMRKLLLLATLLFATAWTAMADERIELDGLFYKLRTASYAGEEGVLQCTVTAPGSLRLGQR